MAEERSARRILLYGVTGSGKSTLAAALAEATGIEWHDVDRLTWEPGWVAVSEDEQRHRFERICAGPEWILDTAYGSWRDVVFRRVELVVGLDYPRGLSLGRLVRRTAARVRDGAPICNGNRETVRSALARDSILLWHFRSFTQKRVRMRTWAEDPALPPVFRFGDPADTADWLARVRREGRIDLTGLRQASG